MSATCICPDIESFEGVATIPTEPLRCGCCGSPLRLTCDGDCGEQHIRGAFAAVAKSNGREKSTADSEWTMWECRRCLGPIPRKVGRAPKYCDACPRPAERARRDAKQIANEAVRAKRNGATS
jgi:hypothetical protein